MPEIQAALHRPRKTSGPFDPYEVLGLRRSATTQDIIKAFRAAAKQAHPDGGGSEEAFCQVRRAYHVLSDPERRARYDKDGVIDDDGSAFNFEALVLDYQANLFNSFLATGHAWRRDVDLIAALRDGATRDRRNNEKALADMTAERMRLDELRARIARKKGPNLFANILAAKIETIERNERECRDGLKKINAAIEELKSYTCVVEMAQAVDLYAGMYRAPDTHSSTGAFFDFTA